MGDINQIIFLKRFLPVVSGPVLEIGSKDYGSTSSFREFYSCAEYLGIDMSPGKNVDLVLDLTRGTGSLKLRHFALAICCSVLEHVPKPWVMAEHITHVVRPGGRLYMSVPWVWRYHAYPDDYFRYSWRGIIELFPEFAWEQIHYSTNVPNEFFEITTSDTDIDNRMAAIVETPKGKRKYLPYLMINMLGVKREAPI